MTRRVLIIEDDEDASFLMSYLFRSAGHDVSCAHDGRAGLEMAERERPDVILLDVRMTPMDGLEVARLLQAHGDLSDVPRIAVTAYAMAGRREQILAGGFTGYISKPIEPTRFVAQVERILAGSRLSNARRR
jgi:CheY-like chemotaxis protein